MRPPRLLTVLPAHWPLIALLTVGAAAAAAASAGATGPAVAGLAAMGYAVALRWGVWRWLALAAAVPVVAGARLLWDADERGVRGALLVGAALVGITWRAWPRPATWVVSLGALAAGVLLVSGADPLGGGLTVVGVPLLGRGLSTVLVLSAACAVAAAAGLGRAAQNAPMRLVALLVLCAPLPLSLTEGYAVLVALVWWPVAGAIGSTALLRGRRGHAALPAQGDGIDEEALAGFRRRYRGQRFAPATVVIAAFNEADALPPVLRAIPSEICGLPADVLVVDDGSTDGLTPALIDSRAFVATCRANRGQGTALRLGYRIAREHGTRFVITTDADGQYDAADFPAVLAPVLEDRADFVTGSRILGHQHAHDRVRRAGVHVFAWLASLLTGRRLTDTSFGLRAMRVEVTAGVTLTQPQYQSSELLLGAISHGFRILEVPASMHARSSGSTKKGRDLVYGSSYFKAMTVTWWREGCPRPAPEVAAALRAPEAARPPYLFSRGGRRRHPEPTGRMAEPNASPGGG
jgi:hypothetical protein